MGIKLNNQHSDITLMTSDVHDTPNSGDVSLYVKTDGQLYKKESSGVETQVGAPAIPVNRVVFGTGTGISSSAGFTYDPFDGSLTVEAPVALNGASAGSIALYAGVAEDANGLDNYGSAGQVYIYAGESNSGDAGSVTLGAGSAWQENSEVGYGGSVEIYTGDGYAAGYFDMWCGESAIDSGAPITLRGGHGAHGGQGAVIQVGGTVGYQGKPTSSDSVGTITLQASDVVHIGEVLDNPYWSPYTDTTGNWLADKSNCSRKFVMTKTLISGGDLTVPCPAEVPIGAAWYFDAVVIVATIDWGNEQSTSDVQAVFKCDGIISNVPDGLGGGTLSLISPVVTPRYDPLTGSGFAVTLNADATTSNKLVFTFTDGALLADAHSQVTIDMRVVQSSRQSAAAG